MRVRRVPVARAASAPTVPRAPPPSEHHENRGATRRVTRLGLLYAIVVLAVYGGFAALGVSGPGRGSSGVTQDLLFLGLLAGALAAGGLLFALLAVPRATEVRGDAWVVVGRFGGRRSYSLSRGLSVRRIRTYPPGLLSPEPVVSVEVVGGRVRRTYLLDENLVPEPRPVSRA